MTCPKYEVFAEGWLQGQDIWGRPVYTQQMKDGSVLISDDYAGAIPGHLPALRRRRSLVGASVVIAAVAAVGAPAAAGDQEAGRQKAEACAACHRG